MTRRETRPLPVSSGCPEAVEDHLRYLARLLMGRLREVAAHRDRLVVGTKESPHDLVTDADRSLEELIWEEVHAVFPDHGFLGEEQGWRQGPTGGTDWVIDPIDGTSNFVSGFPWACSSIGVLYEGQAAGGAVIDPFRGEVYLVAPGRDWSELDGSPVAVSPDPGLAGKLVLLEVPSGTAPSTLSSVEGAVLAAGGSPRVMGSGALALAMVAAGRVQAVVHAGPNIWDVAAGVALVQRAGGAVLGSEGPYELGAPGLLIAGNAESCVLLQRSARSGEPTP